VLLVVTYSREARTTLRNACRSHEATVVRRFGRAALFEATELGAFLAVRLREKHGRDVQVERTRPLNPYADVPERVRRAAAAYEGREAASTPYDKFAAGREHPSPAAMRDRPLDVGDDGPRSGSGAGGDG
jgi:hypothetical protein